MAENQDSANLYIPVIMLVFAISGGVLLTRSLVSTPRPAIASNWDQKYTDDKLITARLWEDPLAAIDRAYARQREGRDRSSAATDPDPPSIDQLGLGDPPVSGPNEQMQSVTVLIAMISGDAFAEDVESRIRSREAVVSALAHAGYRKQHPDTIGPLLLNWDKPQPEADNDTFVRCGSRVAALKRQPFANSNTIATRPNAAFEWWLPRNGKFLQPLLLLWIPQNELKSRPLENLGDLVARLEAAAHNGMRQHPLSIHILGPSGSTALVEMLEESRKLPTRNPNDHSSLPLSHVSMYSWSATIADSELPAFKCDTPGRVPRKKLHDLLKEAWGLEFYNTIATDDLLCDELVAELKLRGVDFRDAKQKIALLFESDTDYGRTLAAEFRSSAGMSTLTGAGSKISEYTYLEGIDGKLADSGVTREKVKSGDSSTNLASDTLNEGRLEMNHAEGRNQLDYIPRVAEQLKIREKGPRGDSKFVAIGVLGSDFYDKLLILQVLRPRFPEAIFFTTDLDARFLERSFIPYTRNLVIASAFGFSLDDKLQGETPPFRESYQTSLYLSCLAALRWHGANYLDGKAPPPRRFEIGWHHAVDFNDFVSRGAAPPMNTVWWAVVALLFAIALLLRYYRQLRSALWPSECYHRRRELLLYSPDEIRSAAKVQAFIPANYRTIEADTPARNAISANSW